MTCSLQEISSLLDVGKVKQFLFPTSTTAQSPTVDLTDDDDWEKDWEIDAEDQSDSASNAEDENDWLQQCCVGVSPTLDCLAVAYNEKLVILDNKWDYDNDQQPGKFEVVWSGFVNEEKDEFVTDILCLPLASQKRSNQWTPGWVCIIVGFSSGYVRMYTESGTLLLSQLLHEEMVLKLKCRTYEISRYSAIPEQQEELTILFPKAIVTIDGFSLFQCLRACRNQVARAVASGGEAVEPPPLAYKKWGLFGQNQVVDHASSGLVSSTTFDQMQRASVTEGFQASVKSSAPAHSLYATVGSGPFLGLYHVIEGSGQPLLTDMAYAVASKLKSALFSRVTTAGGWFGFGNKPAEENKDKVKTKVEPATPLRLKYGLPDVRRCGESISLSPQNNLAVTCDGFGRVILVDLHKGLAIRVWKGYRDAQIAWIQVREDKSMRAALFLIIYAPRRGILEVWTTQMGDRVAAFNVSKWCRLLYPDHGIMGLNNVTFRSIKSKVFPCFLVDTEGVIKVVGIPFHLSLDAKNSKRARDLHLYRKVVNSLKDTTGDVATVKDLLSGIKGASVLQQTLERVLHSKAFSAEVLAEIVHAVSSGTRAHPLSDEESKLDLETTILQQFCNYQLKLLNAYSKIRALDGNSDEEESQLEEMSEILSMSGQQVKDVSQLLKNNMIHSEGKHVHFEGERKLDVSSFLSCFHCPTGRADHGTITLKLDLGQQKIIKLAEFLFSTTILNSENSQQLQDVFHELGLLSSSLISLLTDYWISDDDKQLSQCRGLSSLIKMLLSTDQTAGETNDQQWWKQMQSKLARSSNLSAAVTLALVCRSASHQFHQQQLQSKADEDQGESGWEAVSLEAEEWNTLIRRLEDCLVLSNLFRLGQRSSQDMSVTKILEGGKGIIPELVAKWVASQGLQPSDVIRNEKLIALADDAASDGQQCLEEDILALRMNSVYYQFPKSLTHDALMVNCCWEYTVLWNKELKEHIHLSKALEFLKLVQNSVLQHGTCCMMWSVFIAKKLSPTAALVEKVGKVPKERLCIRDVGMTDTCIKYFLDAVCELIEIFMQANCDANDVPVFGTDELWNQTQGAVSLVELAIDQAATNYMLLRHHYHIIIILAAVFTFSMKSVKPLSLFDVKGQKSFFVDLTSHPYLSSVDASIMNSRRVFLSRVLTEAVCLLPLVQDETPVEKPTVLKWFNLLMAVSKDFDIDPECVRRQFVQELYSSGYDKMAEECLLAISDHEVMGSQLLLTCGLRVSHFVLRCDPPGSSEVLSKMSPKLSTWLKSLDSSQLRHANVPLSDTAKLIAHTVSNLAEGHSEYEMAISLVELIQSLI